MLESLYVAFLEQEGGEESIEQVEVSVLMKNPDEEISDA